MRALTVVPGKVGSAALVEMPEPPASEGEVLIQTVAVGVCGTDREILAGKYGEPPPGERSLVLGHESIGRVIATASQQGPRPGDWVVGMVRHPDPVPCKPCAAGEWDMCANGRYREHGIKGLHGFARDHYRVAPERLVTVDAALAELGVLIEPTSVVAKAWEHAERIASRATSSIESALILGAGPIGLLAALLGAQRELRVHVFDRVMSGPKPELVQALGASYHTKGLAELCRKADILIECTGAAAVIFEAIENLRPNGIVCLAGVSSGAKVVPVDMAALNRNLVLENNVIFGSVNANRRHYEQAASSLARAERAWLERIISRRVPIEQWRDGLSRQPSDVKTILTFASQ